jgi:hypothetical protein
MVVMAQNRDVDENRVSVPEEGGSGEDDNNQTNCVNLLEMVDSRS